MMKTKFVWIILYYRKEKKKNLTLNGPIPDKVKKIELNFYFNTAFRNERVFKG